MQVGFEGMEIILSERERARMVKSLGQDCSASPGKGVCAGEQVHPKQEFTFQVCSSVFKYFLGGTFHQASWKNGLIPGPGLGKDTIFFWARRKKVMGTCQRMWGPACRGFHWLSVKNLNIKINNDRKKL